GCPEALYERPSNLFVADVLGRMNCFERAVAKSGRCLTTHQHQIVIDGAQRDSKKDGVRPERVTLSQQPEGVNSLAGVIDNAIYLGSIINIRVRLDSGESVSAQVSNRGGEHVRHLAEGARIHANFAPTDCVLF